LLKRKRKWASNDSPFFSFKKPRWQDLLLREKGKEAKSHFCKGKEDMPFVNRETWQKSCVPATTSFAFHFKNEGARRPIMATRSREILEKQYIIMGV